VRGRRRERAASAGPGDRAPAPTPPGPPTCADPCADLAPTLPPTLPLTAANWRRTPWLALPYAVCADRRRPPPTAADCRRPAPTGRPHDQRQPSPNRMPGPPPTPRGPRLPAPPIYIQLRMPNIAEVLRSKERYVQEDEPVRIDCLLATSSVVASCKAVCTSLLCKDELLGICHTDTFSSSHSEEQLSPWALPPIRIASHRILLTCVLEGRLRKFAVQR
jgi:hypothetical protein